MKKVNFNRLILESQFEQVKLAVDSQINEVVYNDSSYTSLYMLDGDGIIVNADVVITKYEFDCGPIFEKYDSMCDSGKTIYNFYNYYDDDRQQYVVASWEDYDKHFELKCEHGTETSTYYISDAADIIEGTCYKSDNYVPQDYPNTEYQDAFKFVANDGEIYYVKRTSPFFSDQCDDFFELITQSEFESFED